MVSDTTVLSFSCLCSPIMPLARSWEVSPLLLWQSVVQYNFRFFPTTFFIVTFSPPVCMMHVRACMKLQACYKWLHYHLPFNLWNVFNNDNKLVCIKKIILGHSCVCYAIAFLWTFSVFYLTHFDIFLLHQDLVFLAAVLLLVTLEQECLQKLPLYVYRYDYFFLC